MSAITDRPPAAARRGWAKPVAITVLLLAIAGGLGFAIQRGAARQAAPPPSKSLSGPLELAAADVATVELQAPSRRLPLSGTLTPRVQATVKSRVSGDLLELRVREGDAVRQGDVVARIDTRNLSAQADVQAAAVDKARADVALAKTNLDMNAALLAEHYVSANAFAVVRSTHEAALASLRAAEAQLRAARVGLEDATVRAPIGGVVSQRLAEPGEKLSPDAPLLAIVDLSRLELEAPVPASEIPAVAVGQGAQFRVGGYGDRVFAATVERINPATDAGSRAIRLYLAVDNADGALRGGLFAQGELLLAIGAPVPTVPAGALRDEAGVAYVLVIDGERLSRRPVRPGLVSDDGARVEIRDGLAVGMRVVSAKLDTLADGMAVRVAPAATAAAR